MLPKMWVLGKKSKSFCVELKSVGLGINKSFCVAKNKSICVELKNVGFGGKNKSFCVELKNVGFGN